jgi:hypothetical protein
MWGVVALAHGDRAAGTGSLALCDMRSEAPQLLTMEVHAETDSTWACMQTLHVATL